MVNNVRRLLGSILFIVACQPSVEDDGDTATSGSGGNDVVDPLPEVECLPPFEPEVTTGLAGTFGMGEVDAFGLTISNSTVRWSVFGCDFWGGGELQGQLEQDELVLTAADAGSFEWATGYATLVKLRRLEDGNLGASVESELGPREEVWQPGKMCATCCGDLVGTDIFVCAGEVLEPGYQGYDWSCEQDCAFADP